jgi:hypothetical protein
MAHPPVKTVIDSTPNNEHPIMHKNAQLSRLLIELSLLN